MAAPYEIVTFDCYGTLIDWESGIRNAFRLASAEDGVTIDQARIVEAYSAIEPTVERGYSSYRDVLRETASRVAHALGWAIDRERALFLAESLPSWQPFPDTNRALQSLRGRGIALGILSNVDDDLLAETKKHLAADFELIVTAQQVRSYKPAPPHFTTARERIGNRRWLHAAQSNYHDIVPANALGIPTAWVNRKGETPLPGGKPAIEVANLLELASAI
jgi:2-haloacid dehalogenase/putative hydrolase of the HAD superfamily